MPGIKSLFDFIEQPFSPHFKGKCLSCAVHLHTDHSIDGGSTVKDTIQRCAELGMTHVSVTEHGELSSAAAIHRLTAEHNKKNKTNLKIIHGVEGYLYWPGDKPNEKGIVPTCHITIGFKTQQAFEAYCKLTPEIFMPPRLRLVFGESKPGMYWEDFLKVAEHGVVIGTGCVGSWLNKPILDRGNIEEAKLRLAMMIEAVGKDNIYDEFIVDDISKRVHVPKDPITDKKMFDQATLQELECKAWFQSPDIGKECNRIRWEHITKPAGIKRLFSQDAHYARKRDKIVQDNKRYNNDWIMSMFQHLKGAEEISLLGQETNGLTEKECEELIENTHSYAEHFSEYKFRTAATDGYLIPKYEGDNRAYLLNKVVEVGRLNMEDPVVVTRLNYELDVLSSSSKMDGLSYMRMVGEIQEMAAEAKNLMNARGSGGGSLLAYGMGITVTEPIKYDLPFERFLTVGRILSGSLPDFDLDFASKHEMNTDINKRWGAHVAPLSVDMLLKPRSAMKDVERFYLGGVRQETEILTKSMPPVPQGVNESDWLFGYEDEMGDHVKGHFEQSKELQEYAENNPDIWETVVAMCGIIRQKSIHACAIIIASEPIHHVMPLTRAGGDGELATAYAPKDVEYVGGVKVDILGVSALSTIKLCTELISQRHPGKDFKWGEFPHAPEVYKQVFHTGKTESTFQTKTPGITALCKQTKPKSVADISNLIALYRPACLDWIIERSDFSGNAVAYYVACSEGKAKAQYIHPDLEPIFGNTFGIPVFQESVLRTFRDLGGYSYETAEGVRRAIGKKDAKALAEHGTKLTEAVIKRGWSKEQAVDLFSMVVASARYGFNCISGEQRVLTEAGAIPMAAVAASPEEYQVAYLSSEGTVRYETPSYGACMSTKEVLRVELEDGTFIEATADHKFLVDGLWKPLSKIIEEDGYLDGFTANV